MGTETLILVISGRAGGDMVVLVSWTLTALTIVVPLSVVELLTGSKLTTEPPNVVDAGLGVVV
jgi:hypothetical protein